MRFIKQNMWTLLAVFFAISFAMIGDACARSEDVMSLATTKVSHVFERVKTIVFLLGGFGLVAVAFLAIFGKLNWKWFAGLAVGLAIVAAASAIVGYSTGRGMTGVTDTFNDSVNY